MIGKIAVSAANFAIDKPYSYYIPEGMQLAPGMRVQVPFGKGNHRTEGIVIGLEEGGAAGLKSVECCLDESPLLSDTMLRLAAFLRDRYFCTFYDAARVMLPAPLWFRKTNHYSLSGDDSWKSARRVPVDAIALLELLQELGGEGSETALRKAVQEEEAFTKAIGYLLRKKWIVARENFHAKSREKTEQIATLCAPAEEVMAYASRLRKTHAMQKSVLELMCSIGSVSVKELCYYTGASTVTVKRLAALGYLELSPRPVLRCSQIKPAVLEGPLELNAEQEAVYAGLCSQLQEGKPGVALLYGVTGSGKTSVYLKLIRHCLDQGKSALLLVPEIALTPQLLSLLAAHFGQQVAVQHSSLSDGERYDHFKRIQNGEARVIVGTRSAVFAPCVDPGIIILDEEQEHSYKSEMSPRYSAKEVAIWRGAKENALVRLGSATPSVETMYRAKNGIYKLYTLKERYNGKPLPQVELVNMADELKEGNDLSVSMPLALALEENRQTGQQSILFLNRRGNSRAVVCIDCGQTPECPRCNERLTYHSANERLMCHYCGFSQNAPDRCPACGGALKRIGTGTQKVQQELQRLYPDMQVLRMDTDTVNAQNTHEVILQRFKDEKIPVLLGTQMVAKGLNLPDVTLVGVLDADISLYSGSYRAAETTFNMLTQVVGRAGRGDMPGRAMIQTMVPKHKVLELAARQDYDSFYQLEIQLRQIQKCPPFGDICVITFTGQEESRVLRGGAKFRDALQACLRLPEYAGYAHTVLGPAPCAVPKINYNFRYRLTLRCTMDKTMRALIAHLLRQFSADGSNRGVTAFADINGFDE